MLQEIKDIDTLKEIAREAVIKYTDKIEENRQLRARVAELQADKKALAEQSNRFRGQRDKALAENERLRELVNDFSKAYVDIQRKIINDPIYSELRLEVDGGIVQSKD